jgi:hypothetical protein
VHGRYLLLLGTQASVIIVDLFNSQTPEQPNGWLVNSIMFLKTPAVAARATGFKPAKALFVYVGLHPELFRLNKGYIN